jgi:hypothetical protein
MATEALPPAQDSLDNSQEFFGSNGPGAVALLRCDGVPATIKVAPKAFGAAGVGVYVQGQA